MSTIQHIKEGIYFEESQKLIRWRVSLIDLAIELGLDAYNNQTIEWKDEVCFDFKWQSIRITQDGYNNSKGYFEQIRFEKFGGDYFKLYDRFFKYFSKKIGEPVRHEVDFYDYPNTQWVYEDKIQITLGVGERFVDFFIFVIKVL